MIVRTAILVLAAVFLGLSGGVVPRALAQDDNAWIDAARKQPQPAVQAPEVPLPDRKPARPRAEAAATVGGQEVAKEPPRAASGEQAAPKEAKSARPATGEPELDVTEETNKDLLPESARPVSPEQQAEERRPEPAASAPENDVKAPGPGHEVAAAHPAQPAPAPAVEMKPRSPVSWLHEAGIAAPQAVKPAAELPKAARAAPESHNKKAAVPLPVKKPAKPVRKAAHEEKHPEEKKKQPQEKDAQTPKCVALRLCRDTFARCKEAYVKKTGEWDLEKEPCGAKYHACIEQHFAPGEMFFTRYFWPYDVCPEEKAR